jgi:hypothetical protein
MERHSFLFAVALLGWVVLFPSCRRGGAEDAAAVRARLQEKGTRELLDEVAKAEFQPPADGRLSAGQVRMYVAVRRRESEIRAALADAAGAADAANTAGDVATADLRAAAELGANPKEYAWVRARVVEAQLAAAGARLQQRLAAGRARYLEELTAERRDVVDPAAKEEIGRRIEEFRRGAAAAVPPPDPAVEANVELLARFQREVDAVQSPAERLAARRAEAPASQPEERSGKER